MLPDDRRLENAMPYCLSLSDNVIPVVLGACAPPRLTR
jgi:hypothetical protein